MAVCPVHYDPLPPRAPYPPPKLGKAARAPASRSVTRDCAIALTPGFPRAFSLIGMEVAEHPANCPMPKGQVLR